MSTVILEIDMGNTRAKWRLREGEQIAGRGVGPSDTFPDAALFSRITPSTAPGRILMAAVCDEDRFERAARLLWQRLGVQVERARVSTQRAGVVCGYRDPAALGVDRWLAVLAAHAGRAPGAAGSAVVSCGTALTLDFVRADGRHEGGYILPGLSMMRQALLSGTGRVRFDASEFSPQRIPGDSTAAAVQNGAVHSMLSLIERCGEEAEQRWGGAVELWLTGGDADRLLAGLGRSCHHVEDLVMDGLRYAI